MAAKTIVNGESGASVRTKLNAVLAYGIAFSDWDASGNTMPTNANNLGSGHDGDLLRGDRVIFTAAGTIGGEFWPEGTIATAKQNSPTLAAHWRLY
jgi:hypothetical protein